MKLHALREVSGLRMSTRSVASGESQQLALFGAFGAAYVARKTASATEITTSLDSPCFASRGSGVRIIPCALSTNQIFGGLTRLI